MSAYKGRTIKNKSKLRKETRFIQEFNRIIANQVEIPMGEGFKREYEEALRETLKNSL